MQHPLLYMKPIHVLLRLIGVKHLIFGSTGHHGRDAADEIVRYLRTGYSTMLAPDGPSGPRRVLKRGVLHMAALSGVPIVPLRFSVSPRVELPSWDAKRIPVPFSRMHVAIEPPIFVELTELGRAESALIAALG